MTQYNSLNVNRSNSQLNKMFKNKFIKSTINNELKVVLRLSSNLICNSDDKINFSQELLLTNRQVSNLCKGSANNSLTDIKLY